MPALGLTRPCAVLFCSASGLEQRLFHWPGVAFLEFTRGELCMFFEEAAEIGQVVKIKLKSYFRNAQAGIAEQTFSLEYGTFLHQLASSTAHRSLNGIVELPFGDMQFVGIFPDRAELQKRVFQ